MFMRFASRVLVILGSAVLGLAGLGIGQELGSEFAVGPKAAEYVVAADEAGGFLVAWKAETNATKRLFARRFAANGAALGLNLSPRLRSATVATLSLGYDGRRGRIASSPGASDPTASVA